MVWTSRPHPASALRRTGLIAVALGMATACGSGSVPGLMTTNAQSDIALGGGGTPTPVATAGGGTTGIVLGPPVVFPDQPTLPPFNFPTTPPGSFPTNSPPPVRSSVCPGPAPYATAPNAATTYVQDQPKAGYYFWQVVKAEEKAAKVVITTAKYTNYQITNVSAIASEPNPQGDPTTTFTYDQVSPLAGGHTITYTFQVKQNAPGADVGQAGPAGRPQRVSVPDAGIAIKAEVEKDASGAVVKEFHPTIPVLILPLPIQGGASFNGAGTDPSNGSSMQVQGTIIGPDRVSGCTDYIQGYRTDATVSSSGVPGQVAPTVAQSFIFETQAGGQVIADRQTPANTKITYSTLAGDRVPNQKPRSIPKDQAL